jgi:hypothetical protein
VIQEAKPKGTNLWAEEVGGVRRFGFSNCVESSLMKVSRKVEGELLDKRLGESG